jgi:tRNA pseudouridine13 synthase
MTEIYAVPDFTSVVLPHAYAAAPVNAVLRQHPENFFVEESLGFEPSGEGEHVFLFVEKMGMNTQFVADKLATLAGVAKRQVSYSGMKDRRAVTRQWFSVHLPGIKSVDWTSLNCDTLTILNIVRHRKKLRRGVHRANTFRIKLTQVSGDLEQLRQRIYSIAKGGVPNYFGEQRFGHGGSNLSAAYEWFMGGRPPKRHQRGIYLSAARAYIFNQVLSMRVQENSWNKARSGEWLILNGSHSVFAAGDEDLTARLISGDIHPTGAMYGKHESSTALNDAEKLEQKVFEQCSYFVQGLDEAGLKLERRALRMIPQDLSCHIDESEVELSFTLPRGCFATALMRELADYQITMNDGV